MDRATWEQWCKAKGPRKQSLLSKLLADNEALAIDFVRRFAQSTQYYADNMRDDLLQAARIGIMRALPAWDPDAGGFGSVAWYWMLHEVQQVVRHATGVSVPKSAFLPKKKQDEIARFQAIHGREPEPHEVGLTRTVMERARQATATFVPVAEAEDVSAPPDDVEGRIDHKRDQAALGAFLMTLTRSAREAFWSGERPDLVERAKRFVEERRKP